MRKKTKYLSQELKKVIDQTPAFHQETIKDKHFKKIWKHERAKRLLKTTQCQYCNVKFTKNNSAVLHHSKMADKYDDLIKKRTELSIDYLSNKISIESFSSQYQELIKEIENYYKSLKDTDLICTSCHAKQHPFLSRRSNQRRLF
ncbi:MAG: hypothetical protein Q7S27_00955 [Nanoarchaeota archaeon]|nr:hypothetical protein [Nanoarchaeota archaeon]